MEEVIYFGIYISFVVFYDSLPFVEVLVALLDDVIHEHVVVLLLVSEYLYDSLRKLFVEGSIHENII